MEYIVKKGSHYANPKCLRVVSPNNKSYVWSAYFDDSSRYILEGEDQWDWNKLCGLSLFNFIPNDKYSVRVGWRYNPKLSLLEFCSYLHWDDKVIVQGLGTALPEEVLRFKITVYENEWVVFFLNVDTKETARAVFPLPKSKHFNFGYENNLYFGGNKVAPHDIKVNKELI